MDTQRDIEMPRQVGGLLAGTSRLRLLQARPGGAVLDSARPPPTTSTERHIRKIPPPGVRPLQKSLADARPRLQHPWGGAVLSSQLSAALAGLCLGHLLSKSLDFLATLMGG